MRFIMVAFLLVICFSIGYCQNNDLKGYNFQNGTQSLDSNWVQGYGNWIGSEDSCFVGMRSLSTGEVNCPDSANITVYVVGPGHLQFSWKKSGANTIMGVYLDDSNTPIDYCRGYGWSTSNINILSGSHKIKWVLNFTRNLDGSCIFGTKGIGWLCNVRIPFSNENPVPAIAPVIIEPISSTDLKPENITTAPQKITPFYSGNACISISVNDNLGQIAGNSTGKIFCLDNGYHNGTINITGANDTIIESKRSYEAEIIGDPIKFNLVLYKCNNVTIRKLSIEGQYGIKLKNSNYCKIFNNFITTRKGIGIYLSNDSSNNQIIGNQIYDNDSGGQEQPTMVIEESNNNIISCNRITANGFHYNLVSGNGNKIYSDKNCAIELFDKKYIITQNSHGIPCICRVLRENPVGTIDLGRNVSEEKNNYVSAEAQICPN
jgi:parallel beta-helix repeat protein